jgi:hypothetical protein
VAIPLVLGASSVNYNKQIFNAPPGLGWFAKQGVKKTTKELAQKAAKEAAENAAQKSAKLLTKVAFEEAGEDGIGKAGRKLLTRNVRNEIMEESGGIVTEEVAKKMAKKQVTRQFVETSFTKGAKYFGPKGLKYGAIAGVGWMIFKFGNGAMGALGDILGEAGADFVQGTTQWMGNNPGLAAAGTGVVLFLIGGMIIGMLAPATAAKKVKDTVTSDENGE